MALSRELLSAGIKSLCCRLCDQRDSVQEENAHTQAQASPESRSAGGVRVRCSTDRCTQGNSEQRGPGDPETQQRHVTENCPDAGQLWRCPGGGFNPGKENTS